MLSAFDAAWRAGEEPSIREHLLGGELKLALLLDLLCVDLEHRIKRGIGGRVEDYCAEFPELREDHAALVQLLCWEYTLRKRCEPDLALADYHRRFPEQADAMSAELKGGLRLTTNLTTGHVITGEGTPYPAVAGYEILGELGSGGMGVVYKARQVQLKRDVALKMIRGGLYAGAEERQRFQVEAESVGRLSHPNIVQIYELGEHEGMPYLALEYCAGGSLDQNLRRAPLAPDEAAELLARIARAVHEAHRINVLHRDLKPANILIGADGTPKVSDFGLAKRLNDQSLTWTGAVLGTPSYMPPEQAAGKVKELGPTADVYSLGAVLYECLTGRPPFQGATLLETLEQVRALPPLPPRHFRPRIPRALEAICLKCLAKNPAARYPSAQELTDDLQRFLQGQPVRAGRGLLWSKALFQSRRFAGSIIVLSGIASLVLVQLGLLLGLFSLTSSVVDRSRADVWVTGAGVLSFENGYPISAAAGNALQALSEVERVEPLLVGFCYVSRAGGGRETCLVVGSRLNEHSLGAIEPLSPELREALRSPGAVVMDQSERERLGIREIGDTLVINKSRSRVVGFVTNCRSISGPYLFCSVETARGLLGLRDEEAIFYLARCRNPEEAARVTNIISSWRGNLWAFTTAELSHRTRMHGMTRTKAGIAFGWLSTLLFLGAVATAGSSLAAVNADYLQERKMRNMPTRASRLLARTVALAILLWAVSLIGSLLFVALLVLVAEALTVTILLPFFTMVGAGLLMLAAVLLGAGTALVRAWLLPPARW